MGMSFNLVNPFSHANACDLPQRWLPTDLLTHLNKVAVDDGVGEGRVVQTDLGLAGRQVRLEVYADSPKAPQVVEHCARLELAEEGFETGLK